MQKEKKLTHIDKKGNVKMVDVSPKDETYRVARARGKICMKKETLKALLQGELKKGNVIATAKVAGIMAAKNTGFMIPLCHPLNITSIDINFYPEESEGALYIESQVSIIGRTGVEMEALTAVAVSALTVYDMCKAIDKEMVISDIMLVEKRGGKSGTFHRESPFTKSV